MTIQIQSLCKTYNQNGDFPVQAIHTLDLKIERGEFIAVMGPSGSGKTTLLNIMGGIDTPTEGKIYIEGCDLFELSEKERTAYRRDHIGFIFQDYSLLPVLTAIENVQFVMQLQGRKSQECQVRASSLLEKIGLKKQMNQVPANLSGGQQQRVAVARALAPKPSFVLADEPTANLDAQNTSDLLHIMERLNEEEGTTFIFSTHDPRVIQRAKRVIVIEDGKLTEDKIQTPQQSSNSL